MKRLHNLLDGADALLRRINAACGGVGAVVSAVFWMVVLYFSLKAMLFDF